MARFHKKCNVNVEISRVISPAYWIDLYFCCCCCCCCCLFVCLFVCLVFVCVFVFGVCVFFSFCLFFCFLMGSYRYSYIQKPRMWMFKLYIAFLQAFTLQYFPFACSHNVACFRPLIQIVVNHQWPLNRFKVNVTDKCQQITRLLYDDVLFSSPEPLGSQGELIVYPWSGVRRRPSSVVVRSHFQTSSPLKPLDQSKPNFMWSLLGKGERKFI